MIELLAASLSMHRLRSKGSFFVSAGPVHPAHTTIANAVRIADCRREQLK
jgi:hypothetical protein